METTLSNVQLERENEQLKQTVANLQNTIATFQNTIHYLNEQIEWFKRQIFGKRSEKIVSPNSTQLTFEGLDAVNPEAAQEYQVIERHERKKSNCNGQDAITLPDD